MESQLRHRCRDIYVCAYTMWREIFILTAIIVNACDPQNFEPNLALNLEVVDLINTKKGNA